MEAIRRLDEVHRAAAQWVSAVPYKTGWQAARENGWVRYRQWYDTRYMLGGSLVNPWT